MHSILRFAIGPAIALGAMASACAQTVLTVSSWVPPTVPSSIAQKQWCELLEKNTSKKIRCNILPRAVANPAGTFDAIRTGIADVSFVVHGYTPGRFTLTQIVEFPFLGNSAESMSVAFNKIASKYPQFAQEHRDVHVLAYFTDAPGMLMNTKRPVTQLSDLQGLKWRVSGGIINEVAEALGMNATLKPATDAYELLSGGVMDGTVFPADAIEPWKIDKLIKYATMLPGGLYNTSFAFIMNKARYDKLTPEEKKAIDTASGETAARLFGRAWDVADRRGMALMQTNGVQLTKADDKFIGDIRDRVRPVEKNWIERAKSKGLDNPEKALTELRAAIRESAQ